MTDKQELTLYQQYEEVREQYSEDTLLAFQVGENFEFYNSDAEMLEQELGLELGVRQVGKSHRVPMAQIPPQEVDKVFTQLVQLGHTLAVAEWIIPQPEQFEEEEEPEQSEDTSDLRYYTQKGKPRVRQNQPPVSHCEICGKPLALERSVERGMGDICWHHTANLRGMSLEDHYAELTLNENPREDTEQWIQFAELRKIAESMNIRAWRLVKATGGDRATSRPLVPGLQVWYYNGWRYLKRAEAIEALQHLKTAQSKDQDYTTIKEREKLGK